MYDKTHPKMINTTSFVLPLEIFHQVLSKLSRNPILDSVL